MPAIDELLQKAQTLAAEADRRLSSEASSAWGSRGSLSETIRQLADKISELADKTEAAEARCRTLEAGTDKPCEQSHGVNGETPIQQINKTLHRQKLMLEESQRLAHIGGYEYDLASGTISLSSEALAMYGLPTHSEKLTYSEVSAFFHPKDLDRLKLHYQQTLATRQFEDIEFHICKPDGTERLLHTTGIVFCDDAGEPECIIGCVQDISDRKAVERDLRLTQYTVDQASIGCFWLDEHGRFIYANDLACRCLGYDRQELAGLTIFDVDYSVRPAENEYLWQRVCQAGSLHFQTRYHRKNGSAFSVEITTTLIAYEGHRFVASFFQDITARIKVEEALRLTQFCFDKASIGIFIADSEGRILMTNDRACSDLGYARTELSTLSIFDFVPTMTRERWSEHRRRLGEARTIKHTSFHRKKDGTTLPVEVIISQMEFENDQIAISFVTDLSQRQQAEQERKTLEARLIHLQKMEALGTLAGGIAHDFNNILGAILGYTELARLSCDPASDVRRYLHQLIIACERAKNLVQQILVFSKRSSSEKVPIDIGIIIKEALSLIRASIPSNIDIHDHVKPELGAVLANQTQIHQVIMNLCTNAYHAMQGEGGSIDVDLKSVTVDPMDTAIYPELTPGRYLKLSVRDTGHGMDAAILERIFEPYFTTKHADQGSGMGLATVHGIVLDHGGAIKVYSEPGKGTIFHIWFPSVEKMMEDPPVASAPLPIGNETILLVDDEPVLTDIGKLMLEKLGYRVETVNDASDAVDLFCREPDKYQLVISDMTMPKMTGDRLADQIKKIRPATPIILCTGFSEKIINRSLSDLGADGLLMKPIAVHDLAHLVRQVLDA